MGPSGQHVGLAGTSVAVPVDFKMISQPMGYEKHLILCKNNLFKHLTCSYSTGIFQIGLRQRCWLLCDDLSDFSGVLLALRRGHRCVRDACGDGEVNGKCSNQRGSLVFCWSRYLAHGFLFR